MDKKPFERPVLYQVPEVRIAEEEHVFPFDSVVQEFYEFTILANRVPVRTYLTRIGKCNFSSRIDDVRTNQIVGPVELLEECRHELERWPEEPEEDQARNLFSLHPPKCEAVIRLDIFLKLCLAVLKAFDGVLVMLSISLPELVPNLELPSVPSDL